MAIDIFSPSRLSIGQKCGGRFVVVDDAFSSANDSVRQRGNSLLPVLSCRPDRGQNLERERGCEWYTQVRMRMLKLSTTWCSSSCLAQQMETLQSVSIQFIKLNTNFHKTLSRRSVRGRVLHACVLLCGFTLACKKPNEVTSCVTLPGGALPAANFDCWLAKFSQA